MPNFHEKNDFSWELWPQNEQNRFADANRPPSVTQVTLPQGLGRVILVAPGRVLLQRRAGHNYTVGPIKVRIARDPMCEISMLGACFVYLFIAEPPGNAPGPRKFVFDEFR